MTFGFRIRFTFPPTARLPIDDAKWVLHEEGGVSVYLTSIDGVQPMAQATDAAMIGTGFATDTESEASGARWRNVLQIALARLQIGVDFHELSTKFEGGLTAAGLAAMGVDRPVLNDRAGVVVFEEPRPLFASASAQFVVQPSSRRMQATFAAAAALEDVESAREERLAYLLYGASFFEPIPDARFVMLMMALETMIHPEPRPPAVQAFVQGLMEQVKIAALPNEQIASITGTMNWLMVESIGQAGRRLAQTLGDRQYLGMSPNKFFRCCYQIRSDLVHGNDPRPSVSEVGLHAANLEQFVGDLLGRQLLHVTQEWADAKVADPDT